MTIVETDFENTRANVLRAVREVRELRRDALETTIVVETRNDCASVTLKYNRRTNVSAITDSCGRTVYD